MRIVTPWLTLLLVGASALDLPKSFLRGSDVKPLRERKTTVADGVYTVDDDFNAGTLINVNHDDVHDQLQLDSKSTPFDFIWVAKSGVGTIVKVRTTDGTVLGEYRSTPLSHGGGDPSRTTVDQDGSVWLTNRNDVGPGYYGTIVHIGLMENGQCEDRNNNGVIDTSTGKGDIKPWENDSGTRGVATAEDECIVHYLEVNSKGTRHVSIDADNNVWVGGYDLRNFDLVKGGRYDVPGSGTIIRSENSVGYGGYGGLMDENGVIWSSRPLLRWHVTKTLTGENGDPGGLSIGPPVENRNWAGQYPDGYESYGLCIDSVGNVWNTQLYGDLIRKYAPDGTFIGEYSHGSYNAQGCVVGPNDDVWVAHSLIGPSSTVGRLRNDGFYIGNVEVGVGPTGVAVDRAGKVWSANYNSGTLSRIDPTLDVAGKVDMTVDLGADAWPYNYGDMTGSTNIAPPNTGSWTILHNGPWKRVVWTAQVPDGNSLVVEARSSADGSWVPVANGEDLTGIMPVGTYLEVRVSFTRVPGTPSPILYDLAIRSNDPNPPPDCTKAIASPAVLWSPNHKFVNIGISGVTDPEGQVTTLTVTSISQDEPLDAAGDGKFEPDGQGVGTATAQVRAERTGNAPKNGRVYVIGFTATDAYGAACTGSVQVCVPHDQKKPIKCTLDSPLYDSMTGLLVV